MLGNAELVKKINPAPLWLSIKPYWKGLFKYPFILITRLRVILERCGIKNVDIKIVWWLCLLLITILFHSKHILDSDEGVILDGAWNLLNGKKLYIDFFEFITPGSFYIVLWAWKIFGASYWVAKFLSILIIFFSAVGLYKISNK